MKINIKDVLKNDTEKADLHSEHWLTDAMEAEEKSAPVESESAEMPDTDSDPGVEAFESEMPDTDSEEEIPEAEELAEELTEGILSESETEAVSAETPVEPESAASIQAPSQPDMRAQMQQQTQQAEPATQQEATAAAPMAAAEAAETSDAPVAEKTPEPSTAEPAEPPKTEAQDGEIPAVEETEAEQLCRKKEKRSFKKFGWAYGLAAAFALLLFVTFAYTSLVPREVNATINGQNYKVESKAFTIDEFLDEQHIKYCEDDYISRPVTTFIYDGISFKLKHATDFKVTADGKTKNYKTLCRTVGDALKDCKIKVGDADIVTPGLDTEIGDGLEVVIQRVTTSQETVEEDVDFNTIEKDDPSMEEGKSKVETEGSKGRDKVTYEITYIDGVESERKEISRETVTAAVDKVILNGTKISFNGKSYSRKLVVKAYSYTGGGRTAMGTRARVGEIAVDPRVIPLGSKVYIEGVGARIAEDTGGNIKGNTIDIYMNSVAECRKWGARTVTIYIQ